MTLDRKSPYLAGFIVAAAYTLAYGPAQANERLVSGSVGFGVSYGPTFLGSDENESTLFPILDLEIGRYGFLNQRGLGLQNSNVVGDGNLSYGIGLGYDFEERIAADDRRLTGLPDVEAGAAATVFVEYEVGHLAYGLEVQHGLADDGHEGTRAKLYGTYSAQLSGRVRVSATPYLVWADDAWMEAYFSVTADQSATSGLAAYDASSGLAQGGIALTGSYALSERTVLFTSLDIATLTGDAKDSSVSLDDTQASISTGVMFRF